MFISDVILSKNEHGERIDMNKKEFEILTALEETGAGMTQRELAARTGLAVGTVNKCVRGLCEHGLMKDGNITDEGRLALEPYRVKRAVFLAAGFGSRLVPITFNTPKPLVRVCGKRMIDTLLDAVVAAEIPEIVIVRGYLGEQFDQLLYQYPNIKFVENPKYNEENNISSAVLVREMLENAYVLESDLILKNQKLIRKYEYCSNFLGISVEKTDDWCFYTDSSGVITSQAVGGTNCRQMVGISYWDAPSGRSLCRDLFDVYTAPGGKERYWDQVPTDYKKENYRIEVRSCTFEDVIEIDTFGELKRVDPLYAQ